MTQVLNVFKELLLVLRLKGIQRSPNRGGSKIGMIKEEALNPRELHPCRLCPGHPGKIQVNEDQHVPSSGLWLHKHQIHPDGLREETEDSVQKELLCISPSSQDLEQPCLSLNPAQGQERLIKSPISLCTSQLPQLQHKKNSNAPSRELQTSELS